MRLRKFKRSDRRVRETAAWKLFRNDILVRDKYSCQYPFCGEPATTVSHVLTRGAHPALKYDPDNCLSACCKCHNEYEGSSEKHKDVMREWFPERWARLEIKLREGK